MPKPRGDNYFYMSKSSRHGYIVILILLIIINAGPYIFQYYFQPQKPAQNYSTQIAALRALPPDTSNKYEAYSYDHKPYQQYNGKRNYDHEETSASLFYFDPNTISAEEWKRLGIKEKTAMSIQKYIIKGGKFRQPEDIRKIWGISPQKMEQLVPYVKIVALPAREPNSYTAYTKTEYKPFEKKKIEAININNADTLGFASLPGIGPGFARRIAKFRDRLGGFYSVDQVAETFGLPDSTFQKAKPYLQVNPADITKLNLNAATEEELKAHPYIRWQLAKLIVAYRAQHGNYKSVEGLKNIMALTTEDYEKIKNYVRIQ